MIKTSAIDMFLLLEASPPQGNALKPITVLVQLRAAAADRASAHFLTRTIAVAAERALPGAPRRHHIVHRFTDRYIDLLANKAGRATIKCLSGLQRKEI